MVVEVGIVVEVVLKLFINCVGSGGDGFSSGGEGCRTVSCGIECEDG